MKLKKRNLLKWMSCMLAMTLLMTSVPMGVLANSQKSETIRDLVTFTGDFDETMLFDYAYEDVAIAGNENPGPMDGEWIEMELIEHVKLSVDSSNVEVNGDITMEFDDFHFIVFLNELSWDNVKSNGETITSAPQEIWIFLALANAGPMIDTTGIYRLEERIPYSASTLLGETKYNQMRMRIEEVKTYPYATQDEFDAALLDLEIYLENVFKDYPANYKAVDDLYRSTTFADLTSAQRDAIDDCYESFDRSHSVFNQKTVDSMYWSLTEVLIFHYGYYDQYESICDYTSVMDVIDTIDTYKSYYTENEMKELRDMYMGFDWKLPFTNENKTKVEGYASVLSEKINGINNSKIDELNKEMGDLITEFNGLNELDYEAKGYNDVKSFIQTVNRFRPFEEIEKQKEDVAELKRLMSLLVKKGAKADYSNVEHFVNQFNDANKEFYTAESWKKFEDAVKAVEYGLEASEQERVDKMAADLRAAYNALEKLPADYTELRKVKDSVPENLNLYTEETVRALTDITRMINWNLKIDEQLKVDQWTLELREAIQNLELYGADYSEVDRILAKVPKELSSYTPESVAPLADAMGAVVRGYDVTRQEEVDKMADDLEKALKGLVEYPADYSKVEEALARVPKDLSVYTVESVTALNNVIDAVEYNLGITKQDKVNAMADAIEKAIDKLQKQPADYTEVNKQLSRVPADLEIYTTESAKAVKDAVQSIETGLGIEQQAKVDKMVADLKTAIDNLVLKAADYTKVYEAIAKVPQDLTVYTKKTVEKLESVLDGIDYNLKMDKQSVVDGYVVAITKAVEELKLKAADYTELDKVIEKIPSDYEMYYDGAEEVTKVLKKVKRDLPITEQEKVDTWTNELKAAVKELKLKKADYSELEKVLETVPSDLTIYTKDSVKALNKVLGAIDYTLDINKQKTVDKYVKDVKDAVENLEKLPADYTELDKVIDSLPKGYDKYYDGAEKVTAVLDKVDRTLTIDKQSEVDALVAELKEAANGLILKKADYSKLNEAVAKVPTDLSKYTAKTVKELQKALDAVEYDLSVLEQKKVDKMTEDIVKAVTGLKQKETVYVTEIKELEYKNLSAKLKEKFDSLEALEKAMKDEALKIDESANLDILYDIVLKSNTDDEGWVKENGEADTDMQVTIAYPDGIDTELYEYFVLHMFDEGNDAGKIEVLNPLVTENGLVIKANKFSPYAIVYVEKDAENDDNVPGGGSDEEDGKEPEVKPETKPETDSEKPSDKPESSTDNKSPVTGDANNISRYVYSVLGSILVMVFLAVREIFAKKETVKKH